MNKLFPKEQDFEYLTKLFALIFHPDFYSSPENISQVLNIPIEQIRQDFFALLSVNKIAETFCAYYEDQFIFLEFSNRGDKETFKKQILSGVFDRFCFSSDLDSYFEVPFWLNHMEFTQLQAQYPALFNSAFKKTELLIKSPTPTFEKSAIINKHMDCLKEAVADNSFVSVYYKRSHSDNKNSLSGPCCIIFYPKYFYYDTDKNFIYCIGLEIVENETSCTSLRVDRISRIQKKSPAYSLTDNDLQKIENVYQKLDYMWGMYLPDEPVSVKVRIFDNTPNIIPKIKAETSLRKYGKLTKDDIGYIYTDTIIGLDNFRSWLRGYGSSVVVLEPQELADKMKESALNVIKIYTEKNFSPYA